MYSQDMFAGWQWSAMRGLGKTQLASETTRIILPQAPIIYNEGFGGSNYTSWFEYFNVTWTPETVADRKILFRQEDIEKHVKTFHELIFEESKKFPNNSTENVFVGGFSQGCSMTNSILVSWPGPTPLGGIVCTSGIIALEESRYNKTSVALSAQS